MLAGDRRYLAGAVIGASLVLLLTGRAFSQARLVPPNSDSFGTAVGVSGERVAVGAPSEGSGAGAAYVYVYDASSGWTLEARLIGDQHEAFGRSVALDGRHLLVGAPGGGSMAGGAAYLFRRDSTGWAQAFKLEAPSPGQGDAFGSAVALRGVHLMVGAPNRTAGAADAGAVYVFENSMPGQWNFRQELTTLDGGSLFGSAIALESEFAIIGAPRADEPRGQAAGKALVYLRTSGSDWVLRAELVASDASAESGFGTAVSIDRHSLTGLHAALVGAPRGGLSRGGAVYLFMEPGGLWTERARYEPAIRRAGDQVGQAVVLDEDNFLVGVPGRDSSAGAAISLAIDTTVYAWHETAWQRAPQPQSDAGFGYSLHLSDRFAVIGAPGEGLTDSTSGTAYVYTRSEALARELLPLEHRMALSSYPNPFRDAVTITVHQAVGAPLVVDIFDAAGRRVAALTAAGIEGEIEWLPPERMPAGTYGVRVRGSATRETLWITRVR